MESIAFVKDVKAARTSCTSFRNLLRFNNFSTTSSRIALSWVILHVAGATVVVVDVTFTILSMKMITIY